jgi:hypothetical protein
MCIAGTWEPTRLALERGMDWLRLMWSGRGGAAVVVTGRIDRVKSPTLRPGHGEWESPSQGKGRQDNSKHAIIRRP